MIGDIQKDQVASAYQPSVEVGLFTAKVKKDYNLGWEILNRSWTELNDKSVIEDTNRGQRTFNAFVDETVSNQADAWKWRGTRSKARNKALVVHAHMTSGYIFPSFLAQNNADEEDRDFSEAMNDSVEWLGNNSNYKQSFLLASMGMLVNPVTYMGAEWYDVMQTIKEKTAEGYTKKEIQDEILSGFSAPIYSSSQILISNPHEQNIQKHRVIFKRRYIEYAEAEAKYGQHENWEYVKPGVKSVYNSDDGLFYDVKDDEHPFLVAEETPLYRRDDTEVCFLGGVYMGNPNVDDNPIRHRDNRGAPKYNVVPFGYQRINEHFFYYKSLMNSMWWDNQLADAQYELAMNTAFLVSNMPTAVMGPDKLDSDIIFPSSVVNLDKDTRISSLLPNLNPGALWDAFRHTEDSMEEASVSDQAGGQLPPGSTKATASVIAQRQAEVMLKAVGKPLSESIAQFGDLMKDVVINHLSIADIGEIVGDNVELKYRTLVLKNKMINGRQKDKIIKFDGNLIDKKLTKKEKDEADVALYEETEKKGEGKTSLMLINPVLFSKAKYLIRVEPEILFPKNKEYQQAIGTQVFAQQSKNPYVSLEALTRKVLYSFYGSETEDLMVKPDTMQQVLGKEGAPQTVAGQQAANSVTGSAFSGTGLV